MKIKKLDANMVKKTYMDNRANIYHHLLSQVNMVRIRNINEKFFLFDEFKHSQEIVWKGRNIKV